MKPTTRKEILLAAVAGEWTGELPRPITKEERYLYKIVSEGGLFGKNGKNGKNGKDGRTPVKGVDYFTEEDIAEIVKRVLNAMENEP